ncbi:MAG: DUF2911 domain-containing protein [Flavobacteriales bacterium]|nr:DUF2911 domain-containing protein [Flavobacteriales bacterium]
MRTKNRIFTAFFGLFLAASASAQLTIPAPSPTISVEQQFATSKISLSYSRPSVKGRKIFGDLVPFDKVWRTGANGATTIYFGEEVMVNGTTIAKGKYGLLSIPGKMEWTLILSKDTTVTSPADYKQENDVVRVKSKIVKLPMSVETFTIDLNNYRPKGDAIDVRLMWDRTMVSFTVSANIDAKIMAQIETEMKGEKKPYYQAARYYFENGKDLKKALEWITEAVNQRPDAYWIILMKAKIQKELKDYDGAIATAKLSIEKAKADQNDDYVKMNEQLIAECEKLKMKK